MFPEIEQFKQHLRRQHPHTTTHRHYTSRFACGSSSPGPISPTEITISDIDDYIAHSQEQGQAIATLNRLFAAAPKPLSLYALTEIQESTLHSIQLITS